MFKTIKKVCKNITAVGTRTLLFGSHQFLLHPIFVLTAWIILYRRLPMLYQLCAIVIHDWGYFGLPNIDGKEGSRHPEIMAVRIRPKEDCENTRFNIFRKKLAGEIIGHSRFYAKEYNIKLSPLFYADKLAVSLYPTFLYLPLAHLSGEIREYIREAKRGKYNHWNGNGGQLGWWLTSRSKMCLMGLGEYGDNPGNIQSGVGVQGTKTGRFKSKPEKTVLPSLTLHQIAILRETGKCIKYTSAGYLATVTSLLIGTIYVNLEKLKELGLVTILKTDRTLVKITERGKEVLDTLP